MNRLYEGKYNDRAWNVYVDGELLDIERSQKVWHKAQSFAWGYAGSGPSQLALALLLEEGLDDGEAIHMMHIFKRDKLTTIGLDEDWQMESEEIQTFIASQRIIEQVAFKDLGCVFLLCEESQSSHRSDFCREHQRRWESYCQYTTENGILQLDIFDWIVEAMRND